MFLEVLKSLLQWVNNILCTDDVAICLYIITMHLVIYSIRGSVMKCFALRRD